MNMAMTNEERSKWWGSMIENRHKLRKKRKLAAGPSLAEKILLKRQIKDQEDNLPLGTSATDLYSDGPARKQQNDPTKQQPNGKSNEPGTDHQKPGKNQFIDYEETKPKQKKPPNPSKKKVTYTSDAPISSETDAGLNGEKSQRGKKNKRVGNRTRSPLGNTSVNTNQAIENINSTSLLKVDNDNNKARSNYVKSHETLHGNNSVPKTTDNNYKDSKKNHLRVRESMDHDRYNSKGTIDIDRKSMKTGNKFDRYKSQVNHHPFSEVENNANKLTLYDSNKKQHLNVGSRDKYRTKFNYEHRDPATSSAPLTQDMAPREEMQMSSFSLPIHSHGASSVLPMQENWISWDDGLDADDDDDNDSTFTSATKLPKITHSKDNNFLHRPLLKRPDNKIIFPSINPSSKFNSEDLRQNLLKHRTNSRDNFSVNDSPWAQKTAIPDHLKHLSNDYEPLRVGSLPDTRTHTEQGFTRSNSSPDPRDGIKSHTNSPYKSSHRNKKVPTETEIKQMEKQLNEDLNSIIYQFRDKSLESNYGGW